MATLRTINRLINAVLCDILNVYNPNESIDADDASVVHRAIQDRLASWVDDVLVPIQITESFAMVVGTASYTIGETGAPTVNTARPDKIVGAYVRQSSYDYPVEVITESQYRNLADKTSSGRPEKVYPYYTTPNITLYLYPVPDSTDNFYFVSNKHMTEPTTYTEDTFVTMGLPGYIYDALKWRIAIDVAPGFYKPVSQEILFNANDAFSRMTAKHLARSMKGGMVEMAYSGRGRGRYSKSDFFAGG